MYGTQSRTVIYSPIFLISPSPTLSMPLSLLSQVDSACLATVQLVATDMDGTLTIAEKFSPELLQALLALQKAGMPVVIVTGRSAGWVSGLVHYLPVVGALCENGGLFYSGQVNSGILLVPISDCKQHRQQLAALFQQLQAEFPQIQESDDNRFRLTDWTFDVQGLTDLELQKLRDRCHQEGWDFTYSTVQCHLKRPEQSKAAGLRQVIDRYFPGLKPEQVLTVGDSPNDESLFDPSLFPLSVGVANVRHYCDRMKHQPTYITTAPEGKGFCELTQILTRLV